MVTEVGGLQGRITHADGTPALSSEVTAVAVDGDWKARIPTDADGRYRLANLPVGRYRIGLALAGRDPQQWVPGKSNQADGTVFSVTAGNTTTVDDRYVSVTPPESWQKGTIAGLVTARATGAAVSDACVTAVNLYSGTETAASCTDATGRYRIGSLYSQNQYRLRVRAPGFPEQWAKDANDYDNATEYSVSGFEVTTVDMALRVGGGTIRGRVTPPEGGTLPWSLYAVAKAVDGSWQGGVVAVDGEYQLDRVPAGDYRVYFYSLGRTLQYHPGKATSEEAAVVRVTEGGVTVVDERLVPSGAVEIDLVDKMTGAPTTGCVTLSDARERACTPAGSNRVSFPTVWATTQGADSAEVVPSGPSYWKRWIRDIRVTSGETTRLTVQVEPAATVRTSVVDGGGKPVAGACVKPVSAQAVPTTPLRQENDNGRYCSDASGTVTLGPLPAGPTQLFVLSKAPWGAQWYTSTGGTGDRNAATRLSLVAGQVSSTPAIRLDRAGSITGTLQGPNGEWVDGCAQAGADSPDLPGVAPNGCTSHSGSDHSGRYTVTGLGPYRWPLKYTGRRAYTQDGYAPEWSGDVTSRHLAVPVQVKADATVTAAAVTLVQDASILAFDRGPGAPSYWTVEAYHPITGDQMARQSGSVDGLTGLPAGPVLLRYVPGNGKACWYLAGGATGGAAGGTPRRPC
ncbi:carboxypeptidase regulatory-like domain-containing protein [Micromonospora sp. ATA32]|nr:carboxypeptidase regulatory-like domain-containing protein [Micromonospora sp. ATA32]